MKKVVFFISIFILGFSIYPQNNYIRRQILKALTNAYSNDSTYIFYEYRNKEAIEDFQRYQEFLNFEKYGFYKDPNGEILQYINFTSSTRHFNNDTINLTIKNIDYNDSIDFKRVIKFDYTNIIKYLRRKNGKRYKFGYLPPNKRKFSKYAIIFPSSPIISSNKRYAIVYLTYVIGPLNASGSIILLNRIGNKWVIVDLINTWIS